MFKLKTNTVAFVKTNSFNDFKILNNKIEYLQFYTALNVIEQFYKDNKTIILKLERSVNYGYATTVNFLLQSVLSNDDILKIKSVSSFLNFLNFEKHPNMKIIVT